MAKIRELLHIDEDLKLKELTALDAHDMRRGAMMGQRSRLNLSLGPLSPGSSRGSKKILKN